MDSDSTEGVGSEAGSDSFRANELLAQRALTADTRGVSLGHGLAYLLGLVAWLGGLATVWAVVSA